MLAISKAKYESDYKIQLTFNNGRVGIVNLEETIFSDKRKVFRHIRQKSAFQSFIIQHHTIVWSNELDLAPEYLFYLIFQEEEDYQALFKQWGYII